MVRIIDINVGARAWIWCFDFLITRPIISGRKTWMNCLLGDYLILDVILLLFMIISAWSRVFSISLPCVRSLAVILPKITSIGFGQE